jgi:hypothetical protein
MQASVTAIGSYRGAPAFEYEIRDDAGDVLAVDVVVVHALEGEGWDDLAAVVRGFLGRRAAKWALSERDGAAMLRRRESRTGGFLLLQLAGGDGQAPLLRGSSPRAEHLVVAEVSRDEALKMGAPEFESI